MSRLKRSLTLSNAIALLALFIALGGSVYAASNKIDGAQVKPKSLPGNRIQPNTVTATQIKKGTIGGAQIKAGAVTAKQIQKSSITGTQIKAGSISGAQIQNGSLGATQINQGTLTGISAANIHTVEYVSSTVTLVPEAQLGTPATATCPAGMKVIGGGATLNNKEFGSILESAPNAERSGWYANGFLVREVNVAMTVTAICTPVATSIG